MLLHEVFATGVITAPSWKRWLADDAVPGIAPKLSRLRDLGAQDVCLMAVFEQVAGIAGIELAQDMTRLAGQKIRCGLLSPVIATLGDVTVSVDLVAIVDRVNAAGVR